MPNQTHPSPPSDKPVQPTEFELDRDLDDTFPASDPVASQQPASATPPPRTDGLGQDQGILPTPTGQQKAQAENEKKQREADQERRH